MDSGQLYRIYQNQSQGLVALGVASLDRFKILPLMKFFVTFLKNCKGYNVEASYTHVQWGYVLCIPESGPRAHNFWS